MTTLVMHTTNWWQFTPTTKDNGEIVSVKWYRTKVHLTDGSRTVTACGHYIRSSDTFGSSSDATCARCLSFYASRHDIEHYPRGSPFRRDSYPEPKEED